MKHTKRCPRCHGTGQRYGLRGGALRCGPDVPAPEPRIVVPAPLVPPEFDRSHRFRFVESAYMWPGGGHDVTHADLLDAYASGKELDDMRAEFERLWMRMLTKLT